MAAGNWLKLAVADAIFGGTDLSHLTNVYVALLTGQPTDQDSSIAALELSGTGYGRVAVACPAGWTTPAESGSNNPVLTSNVSTVSFGNAGSAWGTATWFALMTASSSGHLIGYGQLGAPQVVLTGLLVQFAAGALVAQLVS